MRRWGSVLFCAAALLAALVACGNFGAGERGPAPSPVPSPTAVPMPTVTPAPTTTPAPTPSPEPTTTPAPTPDPVERMLAEMSLEELAGQVLMPGVSDMTLARQFAESGVGGLCLYEEIFRDGDGDAVRERLKALQAAAEIPLLLGTDEEGGTVVRVSRNPALREEPFPAPRQVLHDLGWEGVEADAAEKAALLLSLGVNVDFAPVCDLSDDPEDFIYPRCVSGDPAEASEYARRVVQVMANAGLGGTLKHFPGYGGSADTHLGAAYDPRPYEEFAEKDFGPFAAGIDAGAQAVMVSHNIVTCMDENLPASLSPEVHRVLREELGFSGVILTDDLGMGAIKDFTGGESAAPAALLAGNDLLLCGTDPEPQRAAILAAVERGTLPEERLRAAARKVLRWKEDLGLLREETASSGTP